MFRLAPVRDLRLVAVQPFVGELARCPHLAHLTELDLSGNPLTDLTPLLVPGALSRLRRR